MRMRTWARLVAGVFALSLVFAACGGDDDGGGTETGTSGGGGGGDGGAAAITIHDIAYDPSTLQVSSGSTTITITNNDSVTHTFTLDDGSVDQELAGGSSMEVTVDISETTGFHCEIHSSMTGSLEVA